MWCVCGIAHLVVDHSHIRAARDPQHGLDEVVPEGTVEPSGPQDQVLRARRRHTAFTLEFGSAVSVDRCRATIFTMGATAPTEHVISRDVDQRHLPARTGLGNERGPLRVYGVSLTRFRLSPIDCRVSRSVDYEIWGVAIYCLVNRGRL